MEGARNSARERERERAGERESGRAVQLDSGASPDSPDSGPEQPPYPNLGLTYESQLRNAIGRFTPHLINRTS